VDFLAINHQIRFIDYLFLFIKHNTYGPVRHFFI